MSGTTIENSGPVAPAWIAQATNYGLPTFLLIAGGWVVTTVMLVPMRDSWVSVNAEIVSNLRAINERTQQTEARTQRIELQLIRQDPNAWKPSSP